jgi:hypothetical protein
VDLEVSADQQTIARRLRWSASPTGIVLVSTCFVLLIMATWALLTFGSIRRAVGYYLRGETIIVDSPSKSFGNVTAGNVVTVTFRLKNWGRQVVRVVGCSVDCGCVVPDDIPFTVQPAEDRGFALSLKTKVRTDKAVDLVEHHVTLFTSETAQLRIPLVINGIIHQ